ncbi:hypothetical protein ACFSUS_17400 [Spirosoma soli]|uniref:Lipoprotein n=1 Tax=Spirosoma soli TaxID=1770529 RepID=A0ABW5M6V6_9BACT
MNKRLLFCALLGSLTACQQDNDVQPNSSSLAAEVAGKYQTNFFLDPSCVAVPADKMPFAELRTESDSTVTLVYTRLYPNKDIRQIPNVVLSRQTEAIQLRVADSSIGTLQADRIFTDSGMEKQGKLLRISVQSNNPQNTLYFSGYK